MQFRKVVQYVRLRFVPFLVAGVILVSPLSLCARAAVWEGSVEMRVTYWGPGNGICYQMSNTVQQTPLSSSFYMLGPKGTHTVNGMYFRQENQMWTSAVDVYMGGYLRAGVASDTISVYGDPYDKDNYKATYRGPEGTDGEVSGTLIELNRFTPNETMPHGDGISARVGFVGFESAPISDIRFQNTTAGEVGWKKTQGGSYPYASQWVVTSFRVIAAETTAELDELNNVANQIIAGNQILEAMQGEVVGLLQQIYVQTGDLEIAANKTNQMLTTLLGYVDGLEGQLGNIYSTLSSFTAQLISLLQSNNQALIQQIQQSTSELTEILNEIRDYILEDDGGRQSDALDKVEQGSAVQEGLGELQRPDYEDIDTNVGDYVDQFDGGSGESDALLNRFLGTIFESSMVTSMLMISLTFCMVAYVLYGKR